LKIVSSNQYFKSFQHFSQSFTYYENDISFALIILRDFEDNYGNYIYRIIVKDDLLIKERESDIVR